MQFSAKKTQTLYSVSSAELAQKVVKVKFGQIQIHLKEVFTIVRLPIGMQYMQNKTNTMLYIS